MQPEWHRGGEGNEQEKKLKLFTSKLKSHVSEAGGWPGSPVPVPGAKDTIEQNFLVFLPQKYEVP